MPLDEGNSYNNTSSQCDLCGKNTVLHLLILSVNLSFVMKDINLKIDQLSVVTPAGNNVNATFAAVCREYFLTPEFSSVSIPAQAKIIELCYSCITEIRLNQSIDEQTSFLLLVPKYVDPLWLKQMLCELFPELHTTQFNIVSSDKCSTFALEFAIEEMGNSAINKLVFAGVDCATQSHQPAVGAFLVLTKACEQPSSIIINSVAAQSGLNALINVCHMCLPAAEQVDVVIAPFAAEELFINEWYETYNALWPYRINSQQRAAIDHGQTSETLVLDAIHQPEHLNTCLALGSLGAAELPLALAIAYVRLHYPYPAVTHALVCELSDQPWRGAISVSRVV